MASLSGQSRPLAGRHASGPPPAPSWTSRSARCRRWARSSSARTCATRGCLEAHTAELHCALAPITQDRSVHREPFSRFYQCLRYQAMRGMTSQVLQTLGRTLDDLPRSIRREGRRVLEREECILSRFCWLLDRSILACRIRCHGNYHLQQILCSGDDFTVIDFEGEPRRPRGERRLKRSPLHDVADRLRSFGLCRSAGARGPR